MRRTPPRAQGRAQATREPGGGEVAVVGAGAGGLAAAVDLQGAGHRVRLFDKNSHVGGRIRTVRRDGFVIEEGPSGIPLGYKSLLDIVRRAGLEGTLVPAGAAIGLPGQSGAIHVLDPAHLLRDGRRTKLLSTRAKIRLARMALDVVRYRKRLDPEDLSQMVALDGLTAEEFCRTRYGDEAYDYVLDSCVRALVGCETSEVSAADALFVMSAYLSNKPFVAFRDGMDTYPRALGRRFEMSLGSEVLEVRETADSVDVAWRDCDGHEHSESFSGVVLACDGPRAERMHADLDPWRRSFLRDEVTYCCAVTVNVAVSSPPPTTATYVFPPAHSNPELIALALEHNKVANRAPAGKGIITVYPTADWSQDLFDEDDETVCDKVVRAGASLLPGLDDHIEFMHVTRINPMVLRSRPGYWTAMRQFRRLSAADLKVQLAGDYFASSSLNTATASGRRAARALAAALR